MTESSDEELLDRLVVPLINGANAKQSGMLAARAAVLARMSSPSHDRAMAEGGWHDAYGGLIGEAINDAIAMRAAMAGEHVGDKFHAMNWQDKPHRVVFDACELIDRLVAALCDKAVLAPPTPTTKEETD